MSEGGSNKVYRGLIITACVICSIAAVQYMQGLFDRGDLRRASHVVHTFRGPNGHTIEEHIKEIHGEEATGPPVWDVQITSKFFGVIRATATVPLQNHAPAIYRFEVDMVRGGIHPADDAGRNVLAKMHALPTPPSGPGGTTHPEEKKPAGNTPPAPTVDVVEPSQASTQ